MKDLSKTELKPLVSKSPSKPRNPECPKRPNTKEVKLGKMKLKGNMEEIQSAIVDEAGKLEEFQKPNEENASANSGACVEAVPKELEADNLILDTSQEMVATTKNTDVLETVDTIENNENDETSKKNCDELETDGAMESPQNGTTESTVGNFEQLLLEEEEIPKEEKHIMQPKFKVIKSDPDIFCDVDQVDDALFLGILEGDKKYIEILLQRMCPASWMDYRDKDGRSIWQFAMLQNSLPLATMVLQYVAKGVEKDSHSRMEKLKKRQIDVEKWGTDEDKQLYAKYIIKESKSLYENVDNEIHSMHIRMIGHCDKFSRSFMHYCAQSNIHGICGMLGNVISTKALTRFIDAQDIFGWRPLFYAVRSGNHELVKWLCEQGAGIQYSEQDVKLLLNLNLSASMRDLLTRKLKQNSYLSDASFSSLDDPLLLLLEGETNINRRAESTLRTPLHKAAAHGNVQAVEYLLSRCADATIVDADGWNALHHCAQHVGSNFVSIAHILLSQCRGLENSQTTTGKTPLHIAALKDTREENINSSMIDLLVKQGADLNCKDSHGNTPLHLSCEHGNCTTSLTLLKLGCNYRATNNKLWNALHIAAFSGQVPIVHMLQQWDSEDTFLMHQKSSRKKLPAQIAKNRKIEAAIKNLWVVAASGNLSAVSSFSSYPPSNILWHPVSFNTRSPNTQMEILHFTIQGLYRSLKLRSVNAATVIARYGQVITVACRHGANVNAFTAEGETPLMLASKFGLLDIVKHLLSLGAAIDAVNFSGNTALHYAYAFGKMKTTSLLESEGGDNEVCNKRNETPLECAGIKNSINLVS